MAMKEENKIEGFLFGTNLFENLTEADFIREIDNCLKLSERYDSIEYSGPYWATILADTGPPFWCIPGHAIK